MYDECEKTSIFAFFCYCGNDFGLDMESGLGIDGGLGTSRCGCGHGTRGGMCLGGEESSHYVATNLFTGSRDEFGPTWSGHRVVRRLFCESNERAASNTQTTPKTDHISRLSADNQQLCILDKARDDENQFRA